MFHTKTRQRVENKLKKKKKKSYKYGIYMSKIQIVARTEYV